MQKSCFTTTPLPVSEQCRGVRSTVLVIDPNPAIRDMLDDALRLSKYNSVSLPRIEDGWSWLDDAAQQRTSISVLVLLDLSYPVSGGEQEKLAISKMRLKPASGS